MKTRVLVVLVLGLVGCVPMPTPAPPVQDADAAETSDPADVADVDEMRPRDSCAAACVVLGPSKAGGHDCEEGRPTPAGHPCVDVCRANKILPAAKVAGCRDVACIRAAGVDCRSGH